MVYSAALPKHTARVLLVAAVLAIVSSWAAHPACAAQREQAAPGLVEEAAQVDAGRATATITVLPSRGTVVAGGLVYLRASVEPHSAWQRYIFVRASTNGRTWRKIGRMYYSSSIGRYNFRIRPTAHTYYKAYWYDSAGRVRAISNRVRVLTKVAMRFYSSSYTFALGRRVRFSGAVWPNHRRYLVTIQLQSGGSWTNLLKARLNSRGRYSVGYYKPRLTGKYKVRAVFYTPDYSHLGNTAGPKTLTVVRSRANAQGRGVWVTRWSYRNKGNIWRIMRNAWDANLNIVYFQVRGAADAYYKSNYEPWAARLTGTLGRNPGWDPLQTAIDAAHYYGLELHAWINCYTMWSGERAPPSATTPQHIYYKGNDWRVATRVRYRGRWYYRTQRLNPSYLWATPGNPDVREHIEKVALDIASNYDVDGLHLDRIRYPDAQYSWDRPSRVAYWDANVAYRASHGGRDLSRAWWQRSQVNTLVRDIYDGAKDINPRVQVSAAAWGIYTNRWRWPGVSDGLRQYYQDAQGWARSGKMDFLTPMTFWDLDHIPRWGILVRDYSRNSGGRYIYPGVAAYLYRYNWREVSRQVESAGGFGASGVTFFDYTSLSRRFKTIGTQLFPEAVDVPVRGTATSVSLEATTTTPSVDETITLFGTLLPYQSGARISLLKHAGTTWQLLGSANTDSYGTYRIPFKAAAVGIYRLRAIFKGDAAQAPSTSRELVLTSHL